MWRWIISSQAISSGDQISWKDDWQAIISVFSWTSKGRKLCHNESGGASKWKLRVNDSIDLL